MMCIEEHNRFEFGAGFGLYISSGEEFQVIANKLDAFSMAAIHRHHQRLEFRFIPAIYFMQEIFHQRQFARPGRTVKDNVRNFVESNEPVEFLQNMGVYRQSRLNNGDFGSCRFHDRVEGL